MVIYEEIIEGTFIEESKNRFLCKVLVSSRIYECYVGSASKLKNYLKLRGKKVLIKKNIGKDLRTEYSLFAIMYYRKYILLNLSIVNSILEEYLKKNFKQSIIYKERVIEGYKSDFFIEGKENIVVEAKGIISANNDVIFPTVYSSRAIRQMNSILKLLKNGWKAEYYFISLSPIVKSIEINKSLLYKEYNNLLLQCVNNGMLLRSFNLYYYNKEITIKDNVKIII